MVVSLFLNSKGWLDILMLKIKTMILLIMMITMIMMITRIMMMMKVIEERKKFLMVLMFLLARGG